MNPSLVRSWLYLLGFSLRRQARVRQLVGIAVALLLLISIVLALITANVGWDRTDFTFVGSYARYVRSMDLTQVLPLVGNAPLVAAYLASPESAQRLAESAPLAVFSRWVVFFLFLGFLMPLWNLSFATSALGTERESRSLVWLLTRPMPRSGIYVAKFVAVLPWCLALNLGGFALICLSGGATGRQAFALYWPAVVAGSIAFTAVFHLIGAVFSRPAVIGLLYAFFFETILNELPVPGTLKRLSINYYTRCLMYSEAEAQNVPTASDSLFLPVSDATAWGVLIGTTIALTLLGMWLFSRMEYRDEV